ncbi:MAG: hypothetical protein JXQ96_12450 [Cyclobacteriaceae bacterium]
MVLVFIAKMVARKTISLFIAGGLVFSCMQASVQEERETKVTIPETEISTEDPGLSRDDEGKQRLNDKLYSGYLISSYNDGTIAARHGYLDGLQAGMSNGYYANGTKKYERPYLNGEKHGEHFGWYENGQLMFHYYFEDGLSVGNHKDWYDDGSPFKDYNYKKGHPFGAQKMWRTDGKLRANFVIREDGRKYGLTGLKRCAKIDSETKNIDPYKGKDQ